MKTPLAVPIDSLPNSLPTLVSDTLVYPENDVVPWMRGYPNSGNPIADFMNSIADFSKTHGDDVDAALDRLLRS